MESHQNLKNLLEDTLELKNVNHEKLAELTGIPERYLWAIQNLETEKLPAAPYVRGYLKKISETLNLNHDELWELYKKELLHKTSGKYDTLPINRFAIKHLSRKSLLFFALSVLFLFYLLANAGRLAGKPNLVVIQPNPSTITVSENTFKLEGKLNQRDKLTINGEEIFIDKDENFSKEYSLQPGLNAIEFKAKRWLGREITVTKQIMYQPENNLQKTINN